MTPTYTMRLDEEIRVLAEHHAKKKRVSLSAYLRDAIRQRVLEDEGICKTLRRLQISA